MEEVKVFLESSSIHGLAHILKSRYRVIKVSWLLIATAGFTGAGMLIFESFKEWEENPITTTIKTRPITEITLPKITVCPPKNTYTNLNYDLIMLENMTLDNDTRKKLIILALKLIQDHHFNELMYNISLIEEQNRYYNWYHGYSRMRIPFWGQSSNSSCSISLCTQVGLRYYIDTAATSGSISTKYFGEHFNPNKIEKGLIIIGDVYPPSEQQSNANLTLNFDIEKNIMLETDTPWGLLDGDLTNHTEKFRPPGPQQYFYLYSKTRSDDDDDDIDMNFMPGFKIKWFYNDHIVPEHLYDSFDFRR